MSSCVLIDGAGYVVDAVGETYPQCSQLAIVDPAYLSQMTYWADLSVALSPSGANLYLLLTAILSVYVTAWGFKLVARQILNR